MAEEQNLWIEVEVPDQEDDGLAVEHDSCPAISAMGPDNYAPEILRQRICLMTMRDEKRRWTASARPSA